MRKLAVFLVAMACAGPAAAQRVSQVDGNLLLSLCSQAKPLQCEAYISGVADMIGEQHEKTPAACIPVHTSIGQMRGAVTNFLHHHPESQTLRAAGLTVLALHQAFPCGK